MYFCYVKLNLPDIELDVSENDMPIYIFTYIIDAVCRPFNLLQTANLYKLYLNNIKNYSNNGSKN